MAENALDCQIGMGRLMSNGWHRGAAKVLSAPGEDIREDEEPWLRLKQHESLFTLPHHRKKQAIVRDAFKSEGGDRYVKRLRRCAFPDGVGGVRYCRVRTCPICQWRRNRMWTARSLKRVPLVIEAHPKARYGLLTLTAKNCEVTRLREAVLEMRAGVLRLLKRKPLDSLLLGYVQSLEVGRRFDRSAHPHIHILLAAKTPITSTHYISKAEWSKLWRESMRFDYDPIVHCKWYPRAESEKASLSQAVGTVSYITKEQGVTADFDWFTEMAAQLHGIKAIASGGIFKEAFRE